MSDHDELLKRGPRDAPEPETAEQRSRRRGLKTVGGGAAVGGIGLAKAGILSKIIFWFFVWHGVGTAAQIGGWIGFLLLAAVIGGAIYWRRHHWGRRPDPNADSGHTVGASSETPIPDVFQQPPGQQQVGGGG
jgi:hypothetical protein